MERIKEKNKLLMLVSFIASILLCVTIQVLYLIDQLHIPGIPANLIPSVYITEFLVIITEIKIPSFDKLADQVER